MQNPPLAMGVSGEAERKKMVVPIDDILKGPSTPGGHCFAAQRTDAMKPH